MPFSTQYGYLGVQVLFCLLTQWLSSCLCAEISSGGSVRKCACCHLTSPNGSTDKSPTLCCSSLSSTWRRIMSSESTVTLSRLSTCTDKHSFFNVERVQVRPQIALQIHYAEAGGITGHIMLLCMLLIYTTAHHRIRQQSFETFWYTHHLFIPFLLGMYTHATSCFVRDTVPAWSPFDSDNFWTHCIGYEGWRWELVGGGLYFFDRLYREIRCRRQTQIVKVVRHPYGKQNTTISKPKRT